MDQTYRQLLIHYPKELLKAPEKEGKWTQLLAGANDNKVATTYTDYNQHYVMEKAQY